MKISKSFFVRACLLCLLAGTASFSQSARAEGGKFFSEDFSLGYKQTSTVAMLQMVLSAEGVYKGTATGVFGPLTKAAVAKLQKRSHLPASGFVGPLTREILENSLKSHPEIGAAKSDTGGRLAIEPGSITVHVGEAVSLEARYSPPLPACASSTSRIRCMIAVMVTPVAAQWTVADTKLASVSTTCPEFLETGQCGKQIVSLTGRTAGKTTVQAEYLRGNRIYSAQAEVTVLP